MKFHFLVLFAGFLAALGTAHAASDASRPSCRFASAYTTSSILQDPEAFERDLLHWEGMFHQHNVSYNALNGMTFDGTLLDPVTGVHDINGLHTFSAASKESLHMMLLAHVIKGTSGAVQWILAARGGGSNTEKARSLAFSILERKWMSYSKFNETYPGFGGFLPWLVPFVVTNGYFLPSLIRFAHSESTSLSPTWDWVNRVPALDNGENIWGIYAVIEALESVGRKDYKVLASKWDIYLDYLKNTASKASGTIHSFMIF